jgi:hypothetical protein
MPSASWISTVNVARVATGAGERVLGRSDADFGEDRYLVVAALGDARRHVVRVENAGLVDDVAGSDAARLFDEFDTRFSEFDDVACRDRCRIFPIVQRNILVKTGDKFFVGDRFGGGEEAGRRNDRLRCVRHGASCVSCSWLGTLIRPGRAAAQRPSRC